MRTIVFKSIKMAVSLILLLCSVTRTNAQTQPGNCLHFDGSNDYVSGTNSSLPQGNHSRTIEAWVKNSAGNDMTIFNYGDVGNNQIFTLHLYNGIYIIGYNNDLSTGYNINDGNWHHLAVTHNGTTTTVYVDGIVRGTKNTTYNTTGTSFQIGGSVRGGSFVFPFNGSLDEIRVWDVARTQSEIQASMNYVVSPSSSGLIAYYGFNQGTASGTNTGTTLLIDASASASNGTLNNFSLIGNISNWIASTANVSSMSEFINGSQVGSSGDWFYNTIAKDVNSDGYDDILSIDNGNNLKVILSNGSGGFNAATTLGSSLWSFKADDLDNDGDIDIVASSNLSNTPGFYIYKNNGNGSFTLQSSTPTNISFSNYFAVSGVADLVIIDANADGKKDIVLVPYIASTNAAFNGNVKHFLFLNTTSSSTISFSQNAIITTNQPCFHGLAIDIDNDGDQDLVLDGGSGNATEVFKNNGSGIFSFTGYANGYSGGQFFYDWNNDGFLDIITMDGYNGYGLRWKQNDGQGNFAAGVQLLAVSSSNGFLADMNGDGLVDAVYGGNNATGTPGYIQVYTNTGCGFNTTPSIYSSQLSNNTGIGVAKIDANNDGKPDVFVTTRGEVSKTMINNITIATAPVLSTITSVTNANRCGAGSVTLSAAASNGGTINWWYDASGGPNITTANSLGVNVNSGNPIQGYFVDATLNGCTSSRVKVVAAYMGENTSSTSNANVCSNQLPYNWNGTDYSTAGTYTKTFLNSVGCDSITTLNLTIASLTTPSVSISTASTDVCSGNSVNFITNVTNGGSSPLFQWQKNGIDAGSGSSITFLPNTLSEADVITCILTANNTCQTTATATSNSVQLTVKSSPVISSINTGTSNINRTIICSLGSTVRYYNNTPYGVWSSDNSAVASVSSTGSGGNVTANTNGRAIIYYTVTAPNGCRAFSTLAVTVSQQAAPAPISGNNSVCVNATTTLSTTTPNGTTGVWSSSNDRGTIDVNGIYTGKNAGTWGEAKYTVTNTSTGCTAYVSKTITVNPTPNVPTISYAPSTPNPQAGAPSGSFCVGKVFTVVGTPNSPAGVWGATGMASITSGGVVTINAVGSASIKYTYTSAAGCSNSRTMVGNGYTCAARGVNTVDGQQPTIDGFTMYPNPAKGFISLNIETLVGNGNIVVTDLYGKAVKTQPLSMGINTVNMLNLSKGFYLVNIITAEGKATKKLIVE